MSLNLTKTNLIYTILSTSKNVYGLGFSFLTYFTRFFKQQKQQSPKEFTNNQETNKKENKNIVEY